MPLDAYEERNLERIPVSDSFNQACWAFSPSTVRIGKAVNALVVVAHEVAGFPLTKSDLP